MARRTPYEAIFGEPGLAAAHFPRIAEALAAAGTTRPDRERFLVVGEVGDLMGEMAPGTGEGTAQIGLLTFHAFRCWQEGGSDRAVDTETLRELLQHGSIGSWQLQFPAAAGYVELPAHLLWVPGQPAEPVDGFFWVAGDPAANALELLVVLGMHEGRPGLTVIELLSGPLPPEGHWGDLQARPDGEDFANVLPGGEHLYGLVSTGEVLKLASRVFWHLAGRG